MDFTGRIAALAERMLRAYRPWPQVVAARRLSDRGGERAAIMFTVIQTALNSESSR